MATCFLYFGIFFVATSNIQLIAATQINDFLRSRFDQIPLPSLEDEEGQPGLLQVKLFYESMCPGCRNFTTNYFSEVVEKLGEDIDFHTYAYGKAEVTLAYNGTITFQCQHGEPECYGNKLHECADISFWDRRKAFQFKSCMMNFDRAGNGSDDAAAVECRDIMKLPKNTINRIKECARKNDGTRTLLYTALESMEANYTSLPYVQINRKQWKGKPEDFFKDVCAAMAAPPDACKN